MSYWVYIIRSSITGKYYIGQTNNVSRRLLNHNEGKVRSTANGRPWQLFYHEEHNSRASAMKRERQLKNWKSRKAIERLVPTK